MSEHVIELNGKRYDATTGKQIGKTSAAPVYSKKVIDGFVRQSAPKKPSRPTTVALVAAPAKHTTTLPPDIAALAVAKPVKKVTKRTLRPAAKRKPEHSKTLMRTTVERPTVTLKPAIKAQAAAEVPAVATKATLARKQSVEQVDTRRMEKAIHTPKHGAITRFHQEGTPVLTLASEAPIPIIAVQQAPVVPAKPATSVQHTKSASHDIFEAAMHRATSHKQPEHKPAKHRTHTRLINTFAGIAAFLVLAGFIGYLNMPALELRMASVQAGFSASMPDYRPTGYTLTGGVQRIGGTVSVSFRSGANNYTITQQSSDWNSQTLLDNTLALAGNYETIQRNGQTIYMYGNGANAAWVNSGVRYDLTGNATLSKDDVANIATSL